MQTILVTGAAGFIGARLCQQLLHQNFRVIGIDNFDKFYSAQLKKYRLEQFINHPQFIFHKVSILNLSKLQKIFQSHSIDAVIHLAGIPGIRMSLKKPKKYLETNTIGTLNILNLMVKNKIKKIIFASTSSLYQNTAIQSEISDTNHPLSPYAISKKSAELLCYSFHQVYDLDVSILRYFSVYGPASRPDMAPYIFIKNILEGKPIEIFGDGQQSRDFTYIDDIVNGTIKSLTKMGYEIINLGKNQTTSLLQLIKIIEKITGKEASIKFLPPIKIESLKTEADISKAKALLDWYPSISLEEGIRECVEWYKNYKNNGK